MPPVDAAGAADAAARRRRSGPGPPLSLAVPSRPSADVADHRDDRRRAGCSSGETVTVRVRVVNHGPQAAAGVVARELPQLDPPPEPDRARAVGAGAVERETVRLQRPPPGPLRARHARPRRLAHDRREGADAARPARSRASSTSPRRRPTATPPTTSTRPASSCASRPRRCGRRSPAPRARARRRPRPLPRQRGRRRAARRPHRARLPPPAGGPAAGARRAAARDGSAASSAATSRASPAAPAPRSGSTRSPARSAAGRRLPLTAVADAIGLATRRQSPHGRRRHRRCCRTGPGLGIR